MSVTQILKKRCTDTAVYWANPTLNTDGTFEYDTGVEISCLWKNERNLIMDREGREIMSMATIYITQDLADNGIIYHGTLDDLTDAQKLDPKQVTEAYEIKQVLKIPSMYLTDEFNRKIMI